MRARIAVLILLAVAACGPLPPRPEALTLPDNAGPGGAGDPTSWAILSSAYTFGQPSSVAGNPAAAAEALGQLEFLAVQFQADQRFIPGNPTTAFLLVQGRTEARQAFGIRPDTPPQLAVDALYAVRDSLRAGDRDRAAAAMALLTQPGGAPPALARLEALPYLPRAAFATFTAQSSFRQFDGVRRL
ncbi:hypothetical protein [Falsiroseomonas sp. HW251]|uniref:hypothetical protein n=1 Tax=Falsiroseomonas sp. HW251 TaxID=3390998 RepID=UPI003D31D2A8